MVEKNVPEDPVVHELRELKKLMVLMLMRDGANQREIATALGVNQSSISRMFPGMTGKINKAATSK